MRNDSNLFFISKSTRLLIPKELMRTFSPDYFQINYNSKGPLFCLGDTRLPLKFLINQSRISDVSFPQNLIEADPLESPERKGSTSCYFSEDKWIGCSFGIKMNFRGLKGGESKSFFEEFGSITPPSSPRNSKIDHFRFRSWLFCSFFLPKEFSIAN